MIDHIYCINLEKSIERRKRAQQQFANEGLDVEFFTATDGLTDAPEKLFISKGEWGCAMSHFRIWNDIANKGYETSLVFEDDVKLKPNFLEKLKVVLSELPQDWDFVNLGTSWSLSIDYEDYTENIKVGQSITTHAYLIRNKHARKLQLIDPNHLKDSIDTFMYRYPSYNLHVKDPLADQSFIYDTVIGLLRVHDYWFTFRKWWWLLLIVFCSILIFLLYRKIK